MLKAETAYPLSHPRIRPICSLPMILSSVVDIVRSGLLTTIFGHRVPLYTASSVVISIGLGLMTLLTPEASQAE